MSNLLQANISQPIEGLAAWTYTVTATGSYSAQVRSTIPLSSGLAIIIQSNSINLTSSGGAPYNPTPTQQSLAASARSYFTAGDTVGVILSSVNTPDQRPNAVKSIVNLYFGF